MVKYLYRKLLRITITIAPHTLLWFEINTSIKGATATRNKQINNF